MPTQRLRLGGEVRLDHPEVALRLVLAVDGDRPDGAGNLSEGAAAEDPLDRPLDDVAALGEVDDADRRAAGFLAELDQWRQDRSDLAVVVLFDARHEVAERIDKQHMD